LVDISELPALRRARWQERLTGHDMESPTCERSALERMQNSRTRKIKALVLLEMSAIVAFCYGRLTIQTAEDREQSNSVPTAFLISD
jgi:hypothetical protein